MIFCTRRFNHCIQQAINTLFCNSHLTLLALHLHLISIPLHITITSHHIKFWSHNNKKEDSRVLIKSPNWKITQKKVSTIMCTCMSWVLTTCNYELLIIIGLFLVINLNYVHNVIGWWYDLCKDCVHLIQSRDKALIDSWQNW